jgi:peroxiredoxin
MQIQEIGRLARGVFIKDRHDFIRYIEVERELAMDPIYDAAAAVLRQLEQE